MISTQHTTRARASIPAMGASVPSAVLHLAFFVAAVALCALVLREPFLLVTGLLFAVTGAFLSNLVPRWCVLLMLGLGQLWREASATDVVFYALLAGVHFLHILSGMVRHMPWDGRVQLVALVRPLQRFVLVQLVVQTVAVGALLAVEGNGASLPGLSIVAAALLGVVAAILARGLGNAQRREV